MIADGAGRAHEGSSPADEYDRVVIGPRVADTGELSADELLATPEREERVVVRTTFLGSEHDVTLRCDGEAFYCDTPMRLHRHDDEAEMRDCLEEQGYAR